MTQRHRNIRPIGVILSSSIAASAFAQAAELPAAQPWSAAEPWFIYLVLAAVFIGALLSLTLIRAALSNPKWSLADALSEEVEVTALESDGQGGVKPRLDATGKPVMITEMRASTSRVIALMGMMVIMLMFLAFGVFCIYAFAKTGNMPGSVEEVIKFLVAGLTLFAPYLVNKFSSIFEGLTPRQR